MKKSKEKAFTLIELLAVIVILAIIALIAVPVILNIIDKANKSAFKDSAYGVLNAAEYFYAASQLDLEGPKETVEMETTDSRLELKGSIPNGKVIITRDGDIALAVYNDRYCVTKGFSDKDITITEDPENCEIPSGGGNQGTGGNTEKTLTQLAVDNFEVSNVDGSNTTVVTKPACLTDGTECSAGTPVAIQVNDNDVFRFYVLKDENNKVTLIMDRNLYAEGNTTDPDVAWISKTDYTTANTDETSCSYGSRTDEGPLTALNKLNERTSGWSNITEKPYTISGLTENRTIQKYDDMTVTAKARLITYAEAADSSIGCTKTSGSCPDWMYVNLNGTGDNNTYGYWTSTAHSFMTLSAWRVNNDGSMYDGYSVYTETRYGLRPVIELSK